MSSKNITYLFGAGASANSLPLVKQFREQGNDDKGNPKNPFENFKVWSRVQNVQFPAGQAYGIENSDILNPWSKFNNDIDWIKQICLNHSTIDTFAKKLYLSRGGVGNEDLHRLKNTFSAFFVLEQFRRSVDPRYDTFLASITKRENDILVLPKCLKIISWNFDFQFEKSFAPFFNHNTSINTIHNYLNPYPRIGKKVIHEIDGNKFGLVRLNGVAGIYYNADNGEIESLIPFGKENYVAETLRLYHSFRIADMQEDHSFTFAWENHHVAKQAVKQSLAIAEKTEVLVIIGYSFPYFNREIDTMILKKMLNLEKIYYQASKDDIDSLIVRLKGILEDPNYLDARDAFDNKQPQIIPITDVNEFWIPFELS